MCDITRLDSILFFRYDVRLCHEEANAKRLKARFAGN
jgi:hypothetical protein